MKGDHSSHGARGDMAIMFSTFENDAFQSEVLLDPRVCDCCQTSAIATRNGVFVAYRDRSASEVRDISYVRYEEGKWTEPKTLYADGWQIPACPVNGPAVAAEGDMIVVAWYTAALHDAGITADPIRQLESQRSGLHGTVQALFSPDGGKSFGSPVQVSQGNAVGRVDVKWLGDGSALVSWMERSSASGAEIRARRVRPDGTSGPHFVVAQTSSARASGFPRMANSEQDVIFAWTDVGEPSRVRVARFTP